MCDQGTLLAFLNVRTKIGLANGFVSRLPVPQARPTFFLQSSKKVDGGSSQSDDIDVDMDRLRRFQDRLARLQEQNKQLLEEKRALVTKEGLSLVEVEGLLEAEKMLVDKSIRLEQELERLKQQENENLPNDGDETLKFRRQMQRAGPNDNLPNDGDDTTKFRKSMQRAESQMQGGSGPNENLPKTRDDTKKFVSTWANEGDDERRKRRKFISLGHDNNPIQTPKKDQGNARMSVDTSPKNGDATKSVSIGHDNNFLQTSKKDEGDDATKFVSTFLSDDAGKSVSIGHDNNFYQTPKNDEGKDATKFEPIWPKNIDDNRKFIAMGHDNNFLQTSKKDEGEDAPKFVDTSPKYGDDTKKSVALGHDNKFVETWPKVGKSDFDEIWPEDEINF